MAHGAGREAPVPETENASRHHFTSRVPASAFQIAAHYIRVVNKKDVPQVPYLLHPFHGGGWSHCMRNRQGQLQVFGKAW